MSITPFKMGSHELLLTKKGERVTRVELLLSPAQRQQIIRRFHDKKTPWREAAPHYLLKQAYAAYEESTSTPHKRADIDILVNFFHALTAQSAPLYDYVNYPDFGLPFHPAHKHWLDFLSKNQGSDATEVQLKLDFLLQGMTTYAERCEAVFDTLPEASRNIIMNTFIDKHRAHIARFQADIKKARQLKDSDAQMRLFSYQDMTLKTTSLGAFLRDDAHQQAGYAIAAVDAITNRWYALFSVTRNALRAALVHAKASLALQASSRGIRYHNTSAPIPGIQRDIIADSTSPPASDEKCYMDLTPYLETRILVDAEGHLDSAAIDTVAAILYDLETDNDKAAEKESSHWRKLRTGQHGVLGILLVPLWPLLHVFSLFGLALLGICFDLSIAFLRGCIIFWPAVLLLPIAVCDLLGLYKPFHWLYGWLTKTPPSNTSLLEWIARYVCLEDVGRWYRYFSLVRVIKQARLDKHLPDIMPSQFDDPEGSLLKALTENQAEGLINLYADHYLSIGTLAKILHGQIKKLQFVFVELFKVAALSAEWVRVIFSAKGRAAMRLTQRNRVFKSLELTLDDLCNPVHNDRQPSENEKKIKKFYGSIEKTLPSRSKSGEIEEHIPEPCPSPLKEPMYKRFPPIKGWRAKRYETPADFASELFTGLVELVKHASDHNPGISTPAFTFSTLSLATMLAPATSGSILPMQNFLQMVPKILARAFMGTTPSEGSGYLFTHLVTAFLQFKVTHYSVEICNDMYHGNFDFLETLWDNHEPIIVSGAVLVTVGYGMSKIPPIPLNIPVDTESPAFIRLFTNYGRQVAQGLVHTFNTLTAQARHAEHALLGLSSLEYFLFGLKTFMFADMLFSRAGHAEHTLTLADEERLRKLYSDNPTLFATRLAESQPEQYPPEDRELLAKQLCLQQRLRLVQRMEILGIGPSGVTGEAHANQYQSSLDAELMYDELWFAFDEYNKLAAKSNGRYPVIDGRTFLRDFYNKYCYVGPIGLHKVISILLYPLTLGWRGYQWIIGSPTMRAEVTRNNYTDLSIVGQAIAEMIAPLVSIFIRMVLYTLRMAIGGVLGCLWVRHNREWLLPPGTFRLAAMIATWFTTGAAILIGTPFWLIISASHTAFLSVKRDPDENAASFVTRFKRPYEYVQKTIITPVFEWFYKGIEPVMTFASWWIGGRARLPVSAEASRLDNACAHMANAANAALGIHRAAPLPAFTALYSIITHEANSDISDEEGVLTGATIALVHLAHHASPLAAPSPSLQSPANQSAHIPVAQGL